MRKTLIVVVIELALGGLVFGLAACGGGGSGTDKVSYAYVTNEYSNDIYQYTISEDGTLAFLDTTASFPHPGPAPFSIAVNPSGLHAYVTHFNNHITEYTIAADGSLSIL